MKRLAVEILLLTSLLMLIFSAFEWSFRGKQSSYDICFQHLQEQQDSIQQISIGNSHIGALMQLSLYDSAHVFNLGLGGQDLFHMLAVLQKCVPDCPQLNTVLLGVDYDLLGYNFSMEKQVWKDRQYFPYTGRLYDSSRVNCLAAQSAFLRLNRDFRYLFENSNEESKNAGANQQFIPPGGSNTSQAGARQRAIEHSKTKFNAELITENLHYLEEIIQLCRHYQINLVMITTPKTDWYVQAYDKNTIALTCPEIKSMALKYQLPYYDFFDDKRFSRADFLDADHLNKSGGKKLIQYIQVALH